MTRPRLQGDFAAVDGAPLQHLVGLLKYSNLNQLFPQRTYLKRELLISVNQKFYLPAFRVNNSM